jgi:AAA15 family ATPase/GTPase
MTLLRRDQIWFADKNQEGESFLYPLTDYKPRADESLVRGYLSGRYGAVPFIPNGLIKASPAEPALKEDNHAR